MPINDFIQFHFGWLNAWIPSFALVLIQLLYMILYREGGKRAVHLGIPLRTSGTPL